MSESGFAPDQIVYPTTIPLDTGHAWLRHMPLDSMAGDVVVSRVQMLSMQGDGLWVRFLDREETSGWKTYIPMTRVLSVTAEDPAWPTNES